MYCAVRRKLTRLRASCFLNYLSSSSGSLSKKSSTNYLPTMSSGRLDTPQFKSLLTPDLLRIEELFRSEGYSLRLVGGAVRDLLLGRNAKDIDLATDCTPDGMIKLFEREGISSIDERIHTDRSNDYEITTLRIDHVTDGRHALVQFTSDWVKDAERRDLTINSMSLGFDGKLYDYFDGQKHLAERKLLFVGDAVSRIQEDYLRILRYFRFYGRICLLPNAHDPDTLTAIRDNAVGLTKISVERIWSEMSRILVGNHSPHLVSLMYELGVAANIGLPDDGNLNELTKVWESMHGRYQLEPVCLLVSLLKSGEEVERFSRQWKLSNLERKLGMFVSNEREACYQGAPLKYYKDQLVDGEFRNHVLELLKYCSRFPDSTELEGWTVPVCPVNGNDLKKAGIASGQKLGETLKDVRRKWKESCYESSKEDLLATLK
ncbi:PREDICTED: CCA tRNA nucleotidyltransferase 1, mitochondrial-like [Amphimedon queenslandica]|uniref:Poly A polymerase head domain-containing protein n=2 Tax=Amphimedon queenslandica TaxID=400682 RepID=A0AAN0INM0_AMPQE|nr:PREDICTED: CCA tRNA nucleotidyltransferase 1, mitochondrial-like [Amphimedon queenslandica]|eukprot:XP_011405659.2 PREDICTED: CCA tRNA nucleotidyltransferase 1, mitochondrial-like [Amphimedon queenslandica]